MDYTIVFWIVYFIGVVTTFFALRVPAPEKYKKIFSFNVICALMAMIFPVTIGIFILAVIFAEKDD